MIVTKEHAERLSRALESTGLAQPVKANHGDNRISVMCRVPDAHTEKWTNLVKNILTSSMDEAGEVHAWQAHICRNYFIKEEQDGARKLVWGWNVSIQSTEMSLSLDMLMKVLKGQPVRVTNAKEVMEFPLHGAPAVRNAPKNGKGVHTIGGKSDFRPGK